MIDGGSVTVGTVGDPGEGEPEGPLLELVSARWVRGDGDHLGLVSLEGFLAVLAAAGDDAGLLVAEGAGVGG